jgi:hypothetical protein
MPGRLVSIKKHSAENAGRPHNVRHALNRQDTEGDGSGAAYHAFWRPRPMQSP